MSTVFVIILAVLLDLWLGEPRQWHPLAGFGRLASAIERRLHGGATGDNVVRGGWALLIALLPFVLLAWLLTLNATLALLAEVLLLYLAIGGSSLAQHGRAVAEALARDDLPLARQRVGWMVSRDSGQLDSEGVARSTVESLLENGNDALFGALFWFLLLGAPGVVMYRLANTLDAMWGYRTERYRQFGWAAAKFDDLLNWPPARLTALAYALSGDTARAWRCWRSQGHRTDSPNGGVVMAAGAGALGLQLGGPTAYHGVMTDKPLLGEGPPARGQDIYRAIRLVQRALLIWLVVITVVGVLVG
ncbi:MAG: adenosylcobinamide-phosphate synthase CbiB [Gammaproteobacteria bacterium]|nr:adenosylcobinamide-phosphate synthase CbiB [Gammaproteobacteria bacterium]